MPENSPIEVLVKDNVATCNGEPLKFSNELPATDLEADRGQMEYRHIRIKELK